MNKILSLPIYPEITDEQINYVVGKVGSFLFENLEYCHWRALPLNNNQNRLHRSGLLNDILVKSGHQVCWWSSTFDHFSKNTTFHHTKKLICLRGTSFACCMAVHIKKIYLFRGL